MLGVALVVVPTVIAYQAWVYVAFRERIRFEEPGTESVLTTGGVGDWGWGMGDRG